MLEILRRETIGGFLLVTAAVTALVVANSPLADEYQALRDTRIGYAPWHLDLTIGQWAADGLLAIFFFLVGLELKRELITGQLRSARTAMVPVFAAVGGVAVPAGIYLAVSGGDAADGWAIPTATDIAFAVAVLAVVGSRLPTALRLFLLTLAVVDDLIAIIIIATVYTEQIQPTPLLISSIPLGMFLFLAHRGSGWLSQHTWAAWVTLLPLGIVFWAFVHASGIHATIAGVILGFAVPVRGGTGAGLAEQFEHRFRPLSTGVAVPIFAFMAAGVTIGGVSGLSATFTDPIALGVIAGLLLGKPIGVLAATWLAVTFTHSRLDPAVRWSDLAAIGLLAGIGFTVSLLVAELSFEGVPVSLAHAKVAVLVASTGAALIAGTVLATKNRRRSIADQM
ncbi:Na+/H+ antiporter NhaA [Gordonia neofelifaecis]|uniref:Na(+)/H(+) antiporter NhaA n=1 Tax=Gordonia neofelifaecis NRRL B-59395 TaxID=644548 RepID=F1YPX2_9ACTN|nr:Na+/H+ antiporter NhaA [Gordonia neofelifaecis]EGD53261.1 pH-dependent sodium/proton antiporter [Gordonia neofelifaecis NRRL B-59395]